MKSKSQASEEWASLWAGSSLELLKSLHILTREGKLNQDSRRKLKQVQHLVQLITPHLKGLKTIADLGAGKSYLGFILYDLWMRQNPETSLCVIEQRPELIEVCQKIAAASGFDRLQFFADSIHQAIDDPQIPQSMDVVTALHACDTATDEAIAFALKKEARLIALVPCCQAEVSQGLSEFPDHPMSQIWRHGLHRREFGSHYTNVVRALLLESRGYKVRVTELIGWEHSMKNELILAEKIQRGNSLALRALERMRESLPVPMRLFDLVPESKELL